MTLRRIIVLLACAAIAACAQQPPKPPAGEPAAGAPPKPKPRVVVAKPEPRKPELPNVELSGDLLFKMMLAEVAVQRGQPHIAVQAYLELTRETRDPRVAQRATEVAWNARFTSAALETARGRSRLDAGAPDHRRPAGQPGAARRRPAALRKVARRRPR